MEFIRKHANFLATLAICLFGLTSLYLASTDSLTFDERAHIPAAYSYVRYGDIRLNPEHPPLLKDFAGLPLLFLKPQFPTASPEWEMGPNQQWEMGSMFLNCSRPELACNDTWVLTFWSRVPLILVALLLAFFLFWWTRNLAGPLAGLLALTLMLGDPNVLAHSHLVTTDVGITAFLFFSFYFFLRFLKSPSWKNTFLAGLFFSAVQLVKFSAVLLFPLFSLILVLYVLLLPLPQGSTVPLRLKLFFSYLGKWLVMLIMYAGIVYGVYLAHTLSTPSEHLVATAHMMFPEKGLGPLARNIVEYTSSVEFLQPYAAYLLGVFMVFGRVAGGNTHYFLDTVQAEAQIAYFPVVFFSKETLPFIALLASALVYSIGRLFRKNHQTSFRERFIQNIDTILIFSFVIFYSALSIFGNLNIGFRHLFPILPFLYLWIAKCILTILKDPSIRTGVKKVFGFCVAILVGMQIFIPFVSFPYYISYYNELSGGTKNGYRIATDSNYDWGQDLGRLRAFIAYHNYCTNPEITSTVDCRRYAASLPKIEKIRVDYFGGESAGRVLGDVHEGWWSERPKESGWYAISINTLQENWTTHSALGGAETNSYLWLKEYAPIARAGQSIFIYYIP